MISRSFVLRYLVAGVCVCAVADGDTNKVKRPHIIFILADDLGWNDVGFHGSNEIPTPNIDALAYSGLPLHSYYVAPVCTPTRAAILTGKYPIHLGMQEGVIYGAEPRGLPLGEKLLPQYLRELGYSTHLVGKWHLGSYRREYTPLYRGFDSHLGFWSGKIDYYDHSNMEKGYWGHDFRRGMEVAYEQFGRYATEVYSEEAARLVRRHNASRPLFLLVAHSAVHSGNPNDPLRAPQRLIDRHEHIADPRRRRFAGMLSALDSSVGALVSALEARDMLRDSVIVFSSDNGGPANGFNDNAASNYPLRGVKNTLWEGGVRGAGLVWRGWGGGGQLATQLLHAVDWLPTLLSAAGSSSSSSSNSTLDGVSAWATLWQHAPSPRRTLLHNINDKQRVAALTHHSYKLLTGTTYKGAWDGWYGPGRGGGSYNTSQVLRCEAGLALQRLRLLPSEQDILKIREAATVRCETETERAECRPLKEPCLFDVQRDPCELNNLAHTKPEVVSELLGLLRELNATALPPNNRPLSPRGDPKHWGYVLTNFGDYDDSPLPASPAPTFPTSSAPALPTSPAPALPTTLALNISCSA